MYFIYRYTPSKLVEQSENEHASNTYEITDYFSENNSFSKKSMLESYDEYMGMKKIINKNLEEGLYFSTLNELALFAMNFIVKTNLARCNLLSLLELNSAIDETYNVDEFLNNLNKKGTVLNNTKLVNKSGSGSFFGRLLNKNSH